MEIIIHRVNKVEELLKIPNNFGVEIDLRGYGSEIILHHEPFLKGEKFTDFLENYNHGTLVLNIKETGIEKYVLNLLNKFKVKNFFLLDIEFPYIHNSYKQKFNNIALRYSEYEPIENIKIFNNKFKWIWIDTFTKLPVYSNNIDYLKKYKTCLVCPERWGREKDIKRFKKIFNEINFKPTAVMTSFKYHKQWLDT